MEKMKNEIAATPILFPYEPESFWNQIRQIIREEVSKMRNKTTTPIKYDVPGMNYKPLYKISEVCSIFHVSKPTIYDWIKHGKLFPFKVRSRVYFLWNDIEKLFPH
jgi:predicted DNA-binding transcriptional regulator AlpA